MRGYIINIEKESRDNENFRKVLYTANYSQLVVMSIAPAGEIGEEVHGLDQFIRIEEGKGRAILNGEAVDIEDGSGVVIPAGTRHNIVNSQADKSLKLYTLYSPPNHKDATIHATSLDAVEEHFDGQTSI